MAISTYDVPDPVTGAEPFIAKAEQSSRALEPVALKFRPLTPRPSRPPAWEPPSVTRECGRQLHDALAAHPGIAPVLDHLASLNEAHSEPLYIRVDLGEVESIPWETLCNAKDQFMALDARSPMGRISAAGNGKGSEPRAMPDTLRLLAIISAYGIHNQHNEWRMLRKAMTEARAAGLAVEVLVLTGDAATRTVVQADIESGIEGISLGGVAPKRSMVVQDIIAFAPHVLHLFAHGRPGAKDGSQSLELATASDMASDNGQGSVRLRAEDVRGIARLLPNPWLLTLNCCHGADGGGNDLSIAHQAVTYGFASSIAMIDPIGARDAHAFGEALYRALLRDLRLALAALDSSPVGATIEFEMAPIVREGRAAIRDAHEAEDVDDDAGSHEWAVPVLYVQSVDPMRLVKAQATLSTKQRLAIDMAVAWLKNIRETLDEAGRLQVMKAMLADIPESAWPDVNGEFR
ncbi:CHAT domain-containing protein [Paucibacter sp. XJ19-41]|uniref:CHAT domain-containing protein n=1 Tax=Paucibacter sp. XJ19-41 TaxID=2927824 RepID=UPI002349EFC2|nr:CHAT domain-containing protein [Paucibacter sp. XJ19-41]MDC6170702.1 CHAT domain-containing protein [Paucibacter sp. XJ19-41]